MFNEQAPAGDAPVAGVTSPDPATPHAGEPAVPSSGPDAAPAAYRAPVPPHDQLPPGYVWAYQAAPPDTPTWRPPRWLIVATVIWGVALLVAGVVYARKGAPTVRGQTTIVGAEPVVDQAIRNVATAAGTGPVISLDGFTKIGSCRITPVRSGVEYQRTIMVYAAPGTESALLHKIAVGLPASYGAKSGPGAILDFYADAGDYVGVTGAVPAPGEIEIRAATGCREAGGAVATVASPAIASAEMAPVRAVLGVLGVQATSTSAAQVRCEGGTRVMRTVTAHVAPGHVPDPLGGALASLAKTPAASSANLFAYRTGGTDVVAVQDSTGLYVSSTTRC